MAKKAIKKAVKKTVKKDTKTASKKKSKVVKKSAPAKKAASKKKVDSLSSPKRKAKVLAAARAKAQDFANRTGAKGSIVVNFADDTTVTEDIMPEADVVPTEDFEEADYDDSDLNF